MAYTPLADRMRPCSIDEIVGQGRILNKRSILYRMIKEDMLHSSIILYGPPGTGKTTIADVIAKTTNSDFAKINAVDAGKKDIADICKKAKQNTDKRTILFIDEIHRFNKAQQDYLLPFVEDGTVTLIGATTENPYFEVISALVSRSQIFELKPLKQRDIEFLIDKALNDERGLKSKNLTITPDARTLVADQSNGDVRHALSLLELASVMATESVITSDIIKEIIQRPHMNYDKDGDKHYDTISAFIKSMRGSDPDAVLYYLARMIIAGEDPKFIARRLVISASEDIGLANPNALLLANAAFDAVQKIGWPEGRIPLAECTVYLATSPKSNSAYLGIDAALDLVRRSGNQPVPLPIRNAPTQLMKDLGYHDGYKYPHDFPGNFTPQQYLPDALTGERLWHGQHSPAEEKLYERMVAYWGDRYKD